jgi:ATP-binding cassette subfamily F protein 3
MSLVTISKLSVTFLGTTLFRDIGLQVEQADRIGLVGPNGSGKTTLLRLITGEISPEAGEIKTGKGIRIGYLPQDVRAALFGNVLQSVLDSIPGRVELRNRITRMEESLNDTRNQSNRARLAERLAELHQQMTYLEMHFPPHEAERILAGLGFASDDFSRPASSLSEGWKMRLLLGSLLYQEPDLLLLDEPTNHLDIPSVHWLEQFLQRYNGALILVSHDRDFLNRQINRVISLELEGIRSYRGDYDFYLKARDEERVALEAKAKNQEQRAKEARRFIERFRYKASKARQAQSKIKLLKKMELVESFRPQKTIHFSFPPAPRSGREVVAIKEISKTFGQKTLYKGITRTVLRGERIAVIGPNGSGKTTLLRMVAGEIKPDSGEITLGRQVTMSYFAQHHLEMLDPTKIIIEEVSQTVPYDTMGSVRSVCGAFLFSGDDVNKSIGMLSGGEKARVALAKLLVRPGNLMVMDEPTNHLDLISSEILTDALADYSGTLIFVSHNQAFVNRLATKIWDIREKMVEEYPGSLDEYYDHLDRISKHRSTEPGKKQVLESAPKEKKSRKDQKRAEAETRRLMRSTLKPIEDKLTLVEQRITGLEQRKKDLEKLLSDPDIFTDKDKSITLLDEYSELRDKIEELMARWEYGQDQLESARKNLGIEKK